MGIPKSVEQAREYSNNINNVDPNAMPQNEQNLAIRYALHDIAKKTGEAPTFNFDYSPVDYDDTLSSEIYKPYVNPLQDAFGMLWNAVPSIAAALVASPTILASGAISLMNDALERITGDDYDDPKVQKEKYKWYYDPSARGSIEWTNAVNDFFDSWKYKPSDRAQEKLDVTNFWATANPNNVAANIGNGIGSVIAFIGTIALTKGMSGGGSVKLFQGLSNISKAEVLGSYMYMNNEVYNEFRSNAKIDDLTAAKLSSLVSLPIALSEYVGLSALGKVMTKPMVKNAIKGGVEEAIASYGTKGLTKELYQDFTAKAIQGIGNRMTTAALKGAEGAVIEGVQEYGQGKMQQAAEALYDKIANEKVFGTELFNKQALKDDVNNAFWGGAIGGLLGMGGGMINSKEMQESVFHYVGINLQKNRPAKIDGVKKFITQLGENGKITPEQTEQGIKMVDEMVAVHKEAMPLSLTDIDARYQAYEFIQAKNKIQADLLALDEKPVDPTLAKADSELRTIMEQSAEAYDEAIALIAKTKGQISESELSKKLYEIGTQFNKVEAPVEEVKTDITGIENKEELPVAETKIEQVKVETPKQEEVKSDLGKNEEMLKKAEKALKSTVTKIEQLKTQPLGAKESQDARNEKIANFEERKKQIETKIGELNDIREAETRVSGVEETGAVVEAADTGVSAEEVIVANHYTGGTQNLEQLTNDLTTLYEQAKEVFKNVPKEDADNIIGKDLMNFAEKQRSKLIKETPKKVLEDKRSVEYKLNELYSNYIDVKKRTEEVMLNPDEVVEEVRVEPDVNTQSGIEEVQTDEIIPEQVQGGQDVQEDVQVEGVSEGVNEGVKPTKKSPKEKKVESEEVKEPKQQERTFEEKYGVSIGEIEGEIKKLKEAGISNPIDYALKNIGVGNTELQQVIMGDYMKYVIENELPKKLPAKKDLFIGDYLPKGEINPKPIEKPVSALKDNSEKSKAESLKDIVSDDEIRPQMWGVYHDKKNGFLVATDAHKLVRIKEDNITKEGIFVPKTGQKIDAKFPDYNVVIPTDNQIKINVSLKELRPKLEGMERANKFFVTDPTILANIQVGETEYLFSPKLLNDIFKVLEQHGRDNVTIELGKPNRALVINSGDITALAMPTIINDSDNSHFRNSTIIKVEKSDKTEEKAPTKEVEQPTISKEIENIEDEKVEEVIDKKIENKKAPKRIYYKSIDTDGEGTFEFVEAETAKPIKLFSIVDAFYTKENGIFVISDTDSGAQIATGKTLKSAIKEAEQVAKSAENLMKVSKMFSEKNGLSPAMKVQNAIKLEQDIKNAAMGSVEQIPDIIGINALKDVESTAKALEGKNSEMFIPLFDVLGTIADSEYNKEQATRVIDLEIEMLPDDIKFANDKERQSQLKKRLEYLSDAKNKEKEVDELFKELEKDSLEKLANSNKKVAKAYHKAKADGSNPKLVKAVEQAILGGINNTGDVIDNMEENGDIKKDCK